MQNRLLQYRVKIDATHQEKVTFDSGITLYQDTSVEHQEKVTLAGTVTFAPPTDTLKLGIKVGDVIYFRYDVVADSENHGHYREYFNRLMLPGGNVEWFVPDWAVIGLKNGGRLMVPQGYFIAKKTVIKTIQSSLIYIPDYVAEKETDTIVDIVAVGEDSQYTPGDKAVLVPGMAQTYNLESHYGKEILFCKEKYIIGTIHDN